MCHNFANPSPMSRKAAARFSRLPAWIRVISAAPMRSFLLPLLLLAPLAHAADGEPPKPGSAIALLKMIDDGFVQIFEKVAPSVVVIEVQKKADDNALEDKSLDFFPEEEKEQRGKARPKADAGK